MNVQEFKEKYGRINKSDSEIARFLSITGTNPEAQKTILSWFKKGVKQT